MGFPYDFAPDLETILIEGCMGCGCFGGILGWGLGGHECSMKFKKTSRLKKLES
jgi:hypothetical protein